MHANNTRCDGVSRRDALRLGLLAGFGLSLTDLLRLQAASADTRRSGRREISCILLWLDGGPSHLDTFDPKPDAPGEIRGDFNPIPTNVAGIQLCEHLPRTAQVMNHVALIRSITHELGNHDTGSHFLLTGHRPTPAVAYPSLGSIVARETGLRAAIPPYIAIPGPVASAKAGYLSGAYDPYSVGQDPSHIRDLQLPEGVQFERINRRRDFVKQLDDFSRHVEANAATQSRDSYYEQAYRMITSPEAKAAFDLSKEPAGLRERYGPSRIGTGCLLARRLVEAGTRFVTVVDAGWDTHAQISKALPDALFPGSGKLPSLDRAYAALLTDLHERGMLETTLVLMMGEFGRTPKINAIGGRDHWPRAGFACLAGGGVKGGQAIGATDAHGESPKERPIRPEDLAFSLLTLLGVDPHKEVQLPDGRPVRIQAEGERIAELG